MTPGIWMACSCQTRPSMVWTWSPSPRSKIPLQFFTRFVGFQLHCGHCGHCICNGSMAVYRHEILSLVVQVWQGLGKWESASKGFFIASHTCHVSLIGSALTERSVCIEACRVAHWPAVAEAAWLYGQAEETCSANMFWHVLRILDHF